MCGAVGKPQLRGKQRLGNITGRITEHTEFTRWAMALSIIFKHNTAKRGVNRMEIQQPHSQFLGSFSHVMAETKKSNSNGKEAESEGLSALRESE